MKRGVEKCCVQGASGLDWASRWPRSIGLGGKWVTNMGGREQKLSNVESWRRESIYTYVPIYRVILNPLLVVDGSEKSCVCELIQAHSSFGNIRHFGRLVFFS